MQRSLCDRSIASCDRVSRLKKSKEDFFRRRQVPSAHFTFYMKGEESAKRVITLDPSLMSNVKKQKSNKLRLTRRSPNSGLGFEDGQSPRSIVGMEFQEFKNRPLAMRLHRI